MTDVLDDRKWLEKSSAFLKTVDGQSSLVASWFSAIYSAFFAPWAKARERIDLLSMSQYIDLVKPKSGAPGPGCSKLV